MESTELEALHEHYRDSCTVMHGQRAARDRYFYLVVAVIAVVWFDVAAPRDFAAITSDAVKARLQLSFPPDLTYLRSILWFLLLGLVVRYFQATLSVERSYDYLHDVEAVVAENVHPVFGREGRAYLSNYPAFLTWAHYLYVILVPAVLLLVVVLWTLAQIPNWSPLSWDGLVWFNCLISVAICVSVILYWGSRVGKTTAATSKAAVSLTASSRARQRRARS